MKDFASLFTALDATTKTSAKLAALTDYFRTAPEPDRVWAAGLLSGRRPKRTVNATELRDWAAQAMQGLFGIDRGVLEGTDFPGLRMDAPGGILL